MLLSMFSRVFSIFFSNTVNLTTTGSANLSVCRFRSSTLYHYAILVSPGCLLNITHVKSAAVLLSSFTIATIIFATQADGLVSGGESTFTYCRNKLADCCIALYSRVNGNS